MTQTIELDFDLVSTSYDYGFGKVARHTISTRRECQMIGSVVAQVEGQLSVSGIALNPGQKIRAVLTIED